MVTKVFINGSEGTTGLRIKERFEGRNDIELIPIEESLRKDPVEISKKINESDITFLCLPDAAAIEAVSLVKNDKVRIIDASTAHRTNPDWAYGFPELSPEFRDKIKNGKRIAVPGCYATGFISIVYPLVASGILPKEALVKCFSMSGYSGAGKKAIAQYEGEDRFVGRDSKAEKPGELDSPREYALAQQHKHLKEMVKISGLDTTPIFSPIICDYYSGMLVSVPVFADEFTRKVSLNELRDIYAKHYEGEQFVKVLATDDELITGNFVPANGMSGRDDLQLLITGNEERFVISARFDNLGKGASGAAVQCMNIMLGLPEETGLKLGE